MIHRYWRGLAHREHADAYVDFLRTHTVPHLKAIPGFRGVSVLRRPGAEGVEFMVITRWDTLDSIVAFAGQDAERAVVPEEVRQMMREFDPQTRHYVEAL